MLHKNKMADKNIKIIKIINFKVNSTSKESISYDNNKTVKKIQIDLYLKELSLSRSCYYK